MPLQKIRLVEVPVTGQEVKDVQRSLVEVLNRFQDSLAATIRDIEQEPLAGARRLARVAIGTSSTAVYHGLGRVPVGWVVCRRSVNTTIYESGTATDAVLYLIAGSAATIDLLVF